MSDIQTTITCAECEEDFDQDDALTTAYGSDVCPDCAESHFTECHKCDGLFHEWDITWVDGRAYCDSCRDELFVTCDRCGEFAPQDEVETVVSTSYGDTDTVCEYCRDMYFTACEGCGTYVRDGYLIGGMYCPDCGEYYTACDNCGDLVHNDDLYLDDEDTPYCEHCYRRARTRRLLHEWSYKPEPEFFGDMALVGPTCFFGVEVETHDGSSRDECMREVQDLAGDRFYIKSDSSLVHGFEMVSHPMTLDYHLNEMPWDAILKTTTRYGFHNRAIGSHTVGLHVHVSRDYFGKTEAVQDLNIAKLLVLVDRLWPQLQVASRRTVEEMAQYSEKFDLGLSCWDNRDDIVYKSKRVASRGRYQAINLENEHTVEFRMFKGVVDRDTLVASVELVDGLVKYAKRHSLRAIQGVTWANFRDQGGVKGSELVEYLRAQGLGV